MDQDRQCDLDVALDFPRLHDRAIRASTARVTYRSRSFGSGSAYVLLGAGHERESGLPALSRERVGLARRPTLTESQTRCTAARLDSGCMRSTIAIDRS